MLLCTKGHYTVRKFAWRDRCTRIPKERCSLFQAVPYATLLSVLNIVYSNVISQIFRRKDKASERINLNIPSCPSVESWSDSVKPQWL